MRRTLMLAAVVVCVCASSVHAQVVQRPSRPYRGLFGGGPPPDPNRVRQTLTLTASVLGGHVDYSQPPDTVPVTDTPTGFSTSTAATVDYFYGRAARSFSAVGNVLSVSYYRPTFDSIVGADLNLDFASDLSRGSRFSVTQSLAYEPTFILGAFSALDADVPVGILPETGTGVGNGLIEQSSWSSATTANLSRQWNPRHSTAGTVGYSQRTYLDRVGFDNTTWNAHIGHTGNLSRSVALDTTYQYSTTEMRQPIGGALPLSDQALEGSLTYTKRLSPTRQLLFGGGGGATYVQTELPLDRVALDYWVPTAMARVSLDFGRSWSVATDYRRSVSTLQGVSVASYPGHSVSFRTDGTFGSRIEAALSGAFSNGEAGGGQDGGSYTAYSGTAQMRYALSRCCAATVQYDYYHYRLSDFTILPLGFPPEYDRNAIRVGFTLWLPLYGSYGATEGGARGRTGQAR